MSAPPKEKRGRAKTALQNAKLELAYSVVAFLARTLERPFWFFEQWRGRLMDRLEKERSDQ